MTQQSNTFDRYDLTTTGENAKEDIANIISNISPTKTPFTSNAGSEKSGNTFKEWLIDELAAPDTSNAKIDGDEMTNNAADPAERIGNYHQISWKVLGISRRAETVRKHGRKSEMAYQLSKKGPELKRDVEAILMGFGGHQVAAAGSSSVAPTTASIGSWIRTNVSRGAGGASPTLSGSTYGYPNDTPDDGTQRAFSEAVLLDVLQSAYEEGADPNTLMLGSKVKQRFSQYMFSSSARIATPYQQHPAKTQKGITVVGAVDVYVSDFGTLEVVPNRFQRQRDVWLLDFEYWAITYLTKYQLGELAKTHDANRKSLIVDYALVSKNEASSGAIADIDPDLPMVAS